MFSLRAAKLGTSVEAFAEMQSKDPTLDCTKRIARNVTPLRMCEPAEAGTTHDMDTSRKKNFPSPPIYGLNLYEVLI
jgi:hypothetical protein